MWVQLERHLPLEPFKDPVENTLIIQDSYFSENADCWLYKKLAEQGLRRAGIRVLPGPQFDEFRVVSVGALKFRANVLCC